MCPGESLHALQTQLLSQGPQNQARRGFVCLWPHCSPRAHGTSLEQMILGGETGAQGGCPSFPLGGEARCTVHLVLGCRQSCKPRLRIKGASAEPVTMPSPQRAPELPPGSQRGRRRELTASPSALEAVNLRLRQPSGSWPRPTALKPTVQPLWEHHWVGGLPSPASQPRGLTPTCM